jgi:hypothetical protein
MKLRADLRGSDLSYAQIMTLDDVNTSLEAPSAKVWAREKDENEQSMINTSTGPQLIVVRWRGNENVLGGKGIFWRWTPLADELEVKGALIDSDRQEHVPPDKRDRSCKIHRYGFT